MQYKPAPYPMGQLMSQPVAFGNGRADQKMMQICNCFIGMYKIPHTEKAVYNGQGKPDCDRIMATNNMARSALPVNLRPPDFGPTAIKSENVKNGLCHKTQELYLYYNSNLERVGGGNIWNIFSSKMVRDYFRNTIFGPL